MFINSFILYSSGGIHFFAIIENKNMKFTKTKRRRLIFNKLMNFTGWQAYESCLSIKWQRLIIITHNIVHVHSAELVIVINDSDKKVYTNLFSVFFVESAVVGLFFVQLQLFVLLCHLSSCFCRSNTRQYIYFKIVSAILSGFFLSVHLSYSFCQFCSCFC